LSEGRIGDLRERRTPAGQRREDGEVRHSSARD
jgi:hypothetical protein